MTKALQRQVVQAAARASRRLRGRTCGEILQATLKITPADQLRRFADAEIADLRVKGSKGTFEFDVGGVRVPGEVAQEDGEWKLSCCVQRRAG